ncbi:MAG: DUF2905 domain-containing protein, partial [Candidatus Acidiferrales bacterium]
IRKPGMNPANPIGELGKLLLAVGIFLIGIGVLLIFGVRLPFRLGRLPGDVAYQGRHGSFYFPVVTCILLSVALTLLLWILNFFRR